jgi:hypothetical protein
MRHSRIEAPARILSVDVRLLSILVVGVSTAIVTLGWAREFYVLICGPTTALQFLRLFDVERSLTNWLQPILLVIASLLLAAVAALVRQDDDLIWRRWAILSCLFVGLSVDETTNLDAAALLPAGNVLVVLGPIVIAGVVLCAYFSKILFSVPRWYAYGFAVSAFLFVGGGVGLEIASRWAANIWGVESSHYVMAASLEETLETAGAVILIIVLLKYTQNRWGNLGLILQLKM